MNQAKYEATRRQNHIIAAKMAGLIGVLKDNSGLSKGLREIASRLRDEYDINATKTMEAISEQ